MLKTIKRVIIVILGVLLQFGFSIMIRLFFYKYLGIITLFYSVISVLIVLGILKESTRLSNDLPWIILILIFPIFGTILLITLGRNYSKNKLLKNIFEYEKKYSKYLVQDGKLKKEIDDKNVDNINYLINRTNYFVSTNNEITYYNFGEIFYPELLKELKKAEKFIFMEYFIINEGIMWNGILDILKEKAAQGVDVRILYDDMGSMGLLSTNYSKTLAKFGIKCIPFNKLSPFRGIFMNNRDHRKITVIDGKVAFSGGVNLSDEYINVNSKLGIWKDNGIKIVGDAIWNLTVMFLIGEDVYINMINSAKDYLYIMTPYLIIDTDMVNSLCRAAKRGVDVRIIVPGIPDKKIVYTQTTSFFKVLHDSGVKIYKYTNGFVHSKVFLSDDIRAVVGTINMVTEIKKIAKDFDDTFKDSKELNDQDVKVGFIKSLWQAILRLFAPLF